MNQAGNQAGNQARKQAGNRAYISVGSNIEKEINFPACYARLHKEFEVARISSVYLTSPVGPAGQNEYWNSIVEVRTELDLGALREKLKDIEFQFGRSRDPNNKYAARPIDLDIVLYNDVVMDEKDFRLPNPQLEKFAFVLIPMAEIAPDLVHPRLGVTVSSMAGRFDDAGQQWERLPNEGLKGYADTSFMRAKVALITGGATRIGKELCSFYSQKGYAVAIHYNRSKENAMRLAEQLRREGGAAFCVQADLRDPDAPKRLVDRVIRHWGYIDVLINNASVFYPTPMGELTLDNWDEHFAVNLRAPHFLAKYAAPHLGRQQGSIVNIADIYAERPLPGYSAYSVTKAGLAALTKALAHELAPGVRVNAVRPGAILFPEGYDSGKMKALLAKIPLGRTGREWDIAETCFFLTDGPSFITGAAISVDGGRLTTP
jgi:pteridine reductase